MSFGSASEGAMGPSACGRKSASVQSEWRFRRLDSGVGKARTFEGSKFTSYEFFNLAEILLLVLRNKGNGISGSFRPAGSSNAMNVVFGNDGDIEIEDVRDSCNINASRGNISCDHNTEHAVFEAIHSPLALALVSSRVYGYRYDSCSLEVSVNLVCAVFCARKDQDAGQLRVVEQMQKQTDFPLPVDKIDMLDNCFDGVSGYSNLNHLRRFLDAFGEVAYFRSYSSGE